MAATTAANYNETLADIKATIGFIPSFMKVLSGENLVHEWPVFKGYTFDESEIAPRDRELIKLAVATNIESPHYQAFHQGMAQHQGATAKELSEVAALRVLPLVGVR